MSPYMNIYCTCRYYHIVLHYSILGGSENRQWVVEKEAAAAAQSELMMEDTSEDSESGECAALWL